MKIFGSAQLKAWDNYSIHEQGITSVDLMERAATACFEWLEKNNYAKGCIRILCGKGNNGGDGLALARLLLSAGCSVYTYILEQGQNGSKDFNINLQRLRQVTKEIHIISKPEDLPAINKNDLIIDALFGTGLNKPLSGLAEQLVQIINSIKATIISIDIPSGLYCDKSSKGNSIIQATHTLTFQILKLAFLMPENERYTGNFHILDIGLSREFENLEPSGMEFTDLTLISSLIKPRNKFAHKGDFGHAALIAGSTGMMGAAILAAKACLYSGTGKLTCYVPATGYEIMQTAVPEAMCRISGEEHISSIDGMEKYDAVGVGPGLGTSEETALVLESVFRSVPQSMVLDADALNLISKVPALKRTVPGNTVFTPHLKEFERLFGPVSNDFERLELARTKAIQMGIYIVLKGHFTSIITASGKIYFNSSGNPGMAKGGMGDVLTGILAGMLSQRYPLPDAIILGTYLHGLAGDIAAQKFSIQAMQATDLVNCIADAWKLLA